MATIPEIDNDIHRVEKSFGFDTAFKEASRVIQCSHAESKGAPPRHA